VGAPTLKTLSLKDCGAGPEGAAALASSHWLWACMEDLDVDAVATF
jgi:hypothetical protein